MDTVISVILFVHISGQMVNVHDATWFAHILTITANAQFVSTNVLTALHMVYAPSVHLFVSTIGSAVFAITAKKSAIITIRTAFAQYAVSDVAIITKMVLAQNVA